MQTRCDSSRRITLHVDNVKDDELVVLLHKWRAQPSILKTKIENIEVNYPLSRTGAFGADAVDAGGLRDTSSKQ